MIKTVIIEDEEIAAIRLQRMVQEVDSNIVVAKHIVSAKGAIEYLRSNVPDLIFLDIHLSDNNSFEIFKELEVNSPIIFTTAYSEYAIQAFKQNSIDYLLKPISKDALNAALEKFKKFAGAKVPDYKAMLLGEREPYKKRFLVKMNNTLQTVDTGKIAYFLSEDKITFIRLKDGKRIPIDDTLNALVDQLDPKRFFRINRKYLVCIDAIKKMYYTSKSRIQVNLAPLPDDVNVMVSVERLGKFKKWLSL
ncbi:MAG: LytTR family DNA-binding domain-containing protein [Bacteroidota bacterium]